MRFPSGRQLSWRAGQSDRQGQTNQ